jgi:hypothetical protein
MEEREMSATAISEKMGFETFVQTMRGDFVQQWFIRDLIWVLPIYGIAELWMANCWQNQMLTRALEEMHSHFCHCEKREYRNGNEKKMRIFRHLSWAVSSGNDGSFSVFWADAFQSHAEFTTAGRVILDTSVAFGRSHLNRMESDYARLVKASAWLIARRLNGR